MAFIDLMNVRSDRISLLRVSVCICLFIFAFTIHSIVYVVLIYKSEV